MLPWHHCTALRPTRARWVPPQQRGLKPGEASRLKDQELPAGDHDRELHLGIGPMTDDEIEIHSETLAKRSRGPPLIAFRQIPLYLNRLNVQLC